ncbi:aspartyl-tRNA synthetase, cytoplasmic [Ramaria rubella]|nr:aspartyl-tRNA synthetase, cytoplasmic [Ramaria rubella]
MSSFRKILVKLNSRRGSKDCKHKKSLVNGDVQAPEESKEPIRSSEERNESEIESKKREAYDQDELNANYGDVPEDPDLLAGRKLEHIDALRNKKEGDPVEFRARIHHMRPLGSKIVFLLFRQRMATIQGVVTEEEGVVSSNMLYWTKRLHHETIVLVEGVAQVPKHEEGEVKGTTIHNIEIKVHKLYVVAAPSVVLPFQVIDAGRPAEAFEKEDSRFIRVGERTRFKHRVLDLRTPTSQAIFSIHSGICKLFRQYLDDQHFTEINSSKLQDAATESGASLFRVDYFRRAVFLAQSPQLAKQMCIAADMERVYEIGPVFRAENSNTHRHMTEFMGLDLEMELTSNYSEVIDILDSMLLHIFRGLQSQYRTEIELVKQQFPHDDLVLPDKTLRLKFQEGVQLLRDSGWTEEDGSTPGDYDDLSTKGEQRLGQLVKEKYNTDYYILDKFPLGVRPFYTMPDFEDGRLSNSFDFFLRGEEVLSGGQRIHNAPQLENRMREAKIDPDSMKDYVDGFRWGCPPVSLERVIMLFLNLHNVRWASLFPRDPKSFSTAGQDPGEISAEIAQSMVVHGPIARTARGKRIGDLPAVPDLIAKYGDATNTSWVDPAWTVWRHPETGAAVAYIPGDGYAVTFGNPLCEPDQIPRVVRAYLAYVTEEKHLKPVWCCVDKETERHLAQDLHWSAVIAVAEERLDPTAMSIHDDKNMRRKIHHAEREGVNIHEVSGEPDEALRTNIERRLQDWKANRKGTQVHLTGLRPFDDVAHRRYYYATDKEGKICCLLVLAQLSPCHGLQIKWSLEFPGAPTGAIEYILAEVIKKIGEAGVRTATFGAGATRTLQKVDNIGGFRVMMLEKVYNGLSHTYSLANKGDFREKFGVRQDPLYICYPKGSIGIKGVNAIMNVLQQPK